MDPRWHTPCRSTIRRRKSARWRTDECTTRLGCASCVEDVAACALLQHRAGENYMLVSGIKSRPTYAGLEPDPNARRHLIVAQGEGALAVADFIARAADGFTSRATILFDTSGAGSNHVDRLRSLSAEV